MCLEVLLLCVFRGENCRKFPQAAPSCFEELPGLQKGFTETEIRGKEEMKETFQQSLNALQLWSFLLI